MCLRKCHLVYGSRDDEINISNKITFRETNARGADPMIVKVADTKLMAFEMTSNGEWWVGKN